MQTLKKFYFGKQKAKVNTFIGGIGGTINTPALLASRLGISESRIKLFKVNGVDVECAIIGRYTMLDTAFTNILSITYYVTDVEVIFYSRSFAGAENLVKIEFVNSKSTLKATGFIRNYNLKRIYIPNVLSIAETVGNDAWFDDVTAFKSDCVVYANSALLTINSGTEEGDIAYARGLGATIRYVTNFTPPNAITNLSTGTIYNTAIQLNFTPPTSVNGVDFYECYANGKLMNEIKNSGEYISGLTPSTNYNIRIVAVDMFYNKSELSNTVSVSTTNRVATDVDAISYINASSNTIFQDIIDDMFIGFKTQGLYAKIQAFYPFLGTTAAQHKWNAKNPLDTNAAFRLQFFGGGTHSNLGYQCNGTNAYANTFLAPSAVQNVNSNGLTVTVGTNNSVVGSASEEMGAYNSDASCSVLTSKENNTNFNRIASFNNNTIGVRVLKQGINEARGIFTGTKTTSNVHKLIRNSTILGTGTGSGALPTVPIWIGALNINNTIYGASSQRIQFTAIHEGLTDAEVVALHTIIDNFEAAIGRKTW